MVRCNRKKTVNELGRRNQHTSLLAGHGQWAPRGEKWGGVSHPHLNMVLGKRCKLPQWAWAAPAGNKFGAFCLPQNRWKENQIYLLITILALINK